MTAVDVQGQKKNKFAAKVTKKVSNEYTRETCFYIVNKITTPESECPRMFSLNFFSKLKGNFNTWIPIRMLKTYLNPATQMNADPFRIWIRLSHSPTPKSSSQIHSP